MQLSRLVTVVGCHAEGEVGRVITGGVLPPPGASLAEMRDRLRREGDGLRRLLLREPRGGAFVHANLVVPPVTPGAAAGFIVMEPEDYPPMSGSNALCVATVLLETGMVAMREPVTRFVLDAPAGPVAVEAECAGGRCRRVRIVNVPSFVIGLDLPLAVAGLGRLSVDLAYGGDSFALVDAAALGLRLERGAARALVELGETIKAAANAQLAAELAALPLLERIAFVQFAWPLERDAAGRLVGPNAVVISPGKLDRSPCGTGCSARLAVLHARGRIGPGEDFVGRSALGTEFHCRIERTTKVAGRPAVVPSLSGRAWITGLHHYTLDPEDPFPEGYSLSDTWFRALD